MTAVVAPETTARQALITMLVAEFDDDGIPVKDDHLHESLGHKHSVIGVSTERTSSDAGDRYVSLIELKVQFYNKFDLKVDPHQTVSQIPIETYAERFRIALRDTSVDPHSGAVWYFLLDRIDYVKDPTGNKSRFEAYITARGNNSALIETSA